MAKAQKGSGGPDVQVDWSGAQQEPVQPVNAFSAQTNANFHVLSLGFVAPPIRDDVRRVGKLTVPVSIAARVLLTPGDMRRLVDILSHSIGSHQEVLENEPER